MPDTSSYNGLSLTPTMGWDNWNAFGCSVSEDLLLETAHSLVSLGLRDLGYTTVVLDDCWSSGRNETGHLVPDSDKFPNGMLHVANQLHALGLKFGMYSSAGAYTCGRYPGSLGHEELDAQTFAAWGVDYLKYDNCYNEGQSGTPALSFARYAAMARALSATGRDIVYGICNWGDDNPFDWAQTISNSWRMSGDIYDSFQRPDSRCPCTETPCDWPGYHCSVMNILNKMAPIQSRSQPGAFNDMDMLEVGNGGQSDSEYLTHISMWALLSSPLLIGTNIATLSPRSLSLLSNPAILALNQDPSGTAGVRKWRHQVPDVDADGQGEVALWTRELANGDTAVALLNAGNGSRVMRAGLGDVFLDQATAGAYEAPAELSQAWDVFDLWANRMSDEEAAAVIAGNSSEVAADSKTRYNATALPYADGLAANHSALVGQWVGRVQPGGSWEARIERHSVGVYRFRVADGGERDEL
ncbi:glycoside hydrolase family 27 protein [Aplosporella prunicola CBS 121167]|uniref:Alpha-galactosidase n=1 Tax=Aplosporella prunicola CBS 121167 TaxID=1176127 RepID=A0A6A6AYL4_9PEZI|nr:glycoside hydrolase family 27 protein [Aplosporella prunicola CBS 121167]KAF2136870.1 glycoside hydrolase family 27 protein [Aplosporella prunicola CBS 121167]